MLANLLTGLLLLADTPATCTNEQAKIQWLEAKIANLEQRLGAMAAMYDSTVKGFQIEAGKPKEPTPVPATPATTIKDQSTRTLENVPVK